MTINKKIIRIIFSILVVILIIPALIVFIELLSFVGYYAPFNNVNHTYNDFYDYVFSKFHTFKVDDISVIDGDWRYRKSIHVSIRGKDGDVQHMQTFHHKWTWNLVNVCQYRMRVKNHVMQSYCFYPLERLSPFDESENYSYFPIAKIDSYLVEYDENFLKKYCDERVRPEFTKSLFDMHTIKKDDNDDNIYAMTEGYGPDPTDYPFVMLEYKRKYGRQDYKYNGLWYISLQKSACHVPSANDAITFYDELSNVDASKVEILSMAAENLSEIPEILATCKSLKKLFMPFNGVKFSARDMEILSSLENLEVLDIRYTDIANSPDPDLTELKKLKNLKKVYIAGKYYAKDGNVPAVFADMPGLEILSISNAYDVKFPTIYDSGLSPKKIIVAYSKISQAVYKNLLKRSEKNCDTKALVYECKIMESGRWIVGDQIIWEF